MNTASSKWTWIGPNDHVKYELWKMLAAMTSSPTALANGNVKANDRPSTATSRMSSLARRGSTSTPATHSSATRTASAIPITRA
jgi:hypothetical protein